ncbi:MAG TPA: phage tail tape measure protein [Methylomirabilota bacterium]|nr:phage tail tape measure protein [Methylomirabilota bacterium]
MTETDDLAASLATLRALDTAAKGFGATLTSGLKAAAVEGRALDDVLKQMVLRLSSQALDAALKPLADMLGQIVSGFAGAVGSGLSGAVTPFAKGGVVSTPTYFPMGGGGTGLAGEAGPEAILPLERGADGALGVRGGGRPVSVTVNIAARDAESFRRSEAQIGAMLARAVGRGRRGL